MSTMKRIFVAAGLLTAWFSGAAAGTLDTVKQRGTLVCGVSAGFAGFSAPDSQGNYKGLDVDYGRANGIEWKPLVFDRIDTMYQTFFGGRCDAMTQDASALAGAVTTAAPNAADYLVLPQTISKEPLGPFTRNGDEVWTDIIAWLHYGLIEAEEFGVTAANADEMAKSSNVPAIQRLLGSAGELGSRLGLDNKWMVQAIKGGGNYAEIFERNVGQASPLKLNRGLNATWSKGGLMYAIPFK